MDFSSIREYFYKLYIRCYLFLLLPLIVFIFLYFEGQAEKSLLVIQDRFLILISLPVLCLMSVVYLTTVHWLTRKRLKLYSTEVGLGRKLDKYSEVISLRFGAGSASSLIMAVGLVTTGNNFFGLFFILILFWMAVQWPSSKKACKALILKGDEYKMVLYKKDKF